MLYHIHAVPWCETNSPFQIHTVSFYRTNISVRLMFHDVEPTSLSVMMFHDVGPTAVSVLMLHDVGPTALSVMMV